MAHGFSEKSFAFFKELEENNNRDWYNDNKAVFKDHVEAPFVSLLEALTNRLDGTALPLIGGKKTMFRLHRDTRFSEDKRPYKTSLGGMLTPSGSKGEASGLLYLHFASDGGFVASGFYGLSPKQLAPMRQAMVDRADAFSDVLAHLANAKRELSTAQTLSSMPRGFSEHAQHQHADMIKLKSLIVTEDLTPAIWTTGDVIDHAQAMAVDTVPLLKFQKPGV